MSIKDNTKAIKLFKEYVDCNLLRRKIDIDNELYPKYDILSNPYIRKNHALYVNGNKIAEQIPKLLKGGKYSEKLWKIVVYDETQDNRRKGLNYGL